VRNEAWDGGVVVAVTGVARPLQGVRRYE